MLKTDKSKSLKRYFKIKLKILVYPYILPVKNQIYFWIDISILKSGMDFENPKDLKSCPAPCTVSIHCAAIYHISKYFCIFERFTVHIRYGIADEIAILSFSLCVSAFCCIITRSVNQWNSPTIFFVLGRVDPVKMVQKPNVFHVSLSLIHGWNSIYISRVYKKKKNNAAAAMLQGEIGCHFPKRNSRYGLGYIANVVIEESVAPITVLEI